MSERDELTAMITPHVMRLGAHTGAMRAADQIIAAGYRLDPDPRHELLLENERLKVDAANWKQRYDNSVQVLNDSGWQWEHTIRERDALRVAIRRVRERHGECGAKCGNCHACNFPIPCPTVQDLGDAL